MNQIEYNGKMYDCYTLRTCRKFIKAIADGTKTIETRSTSSHNCDLFNDPAIEARNRTAKAEGRELEFPMKKVHFLRLHDQHGVEVLCRIDENGIAGTSEEGIRRLREVYNFHEFDEEVEKTKDLGPKYESLFFYFHIAEVLETKGI